MTRRSRLVLGCAAAGLIAGLVVVMGAVRQHAAAETLAAAPRPLPVQVVTVAASDVISIDRTYTGVLKAARTSDLGFELAGKLVRLTVDEGDAVTAGQVLAELDTATLRANREQLTAERDQAAAILAELEAGPRQEKIAAARASVEGLRADWQLASARYVRSERLRGEGAVAQEDYDRERFGRDAAGARLEAAEQELDELLAGTRREQIQAQRAVVARLQAALAEVALQLEDACLVAPFDGRISARYVDEGTVVSAATPVLRLVDCRNLEAMVGMPPAEAAEWKAGSTAGLEILGKTYSAVVKGRLPELDAATRTRMVIWQLDEASTDLVPGLVVRLSSSCQQSLDGFWLPTAALARSDRGLWSALSVVPGDAAGQRVVQACEVEVLYTREDRTFVRGPLVTGGQVVACGVHRLTPGQQVRIVESPEG